MRLCRKRVRSIRYRYGNCGQSVYPTGDDLVPDLSDAKVENGIVLYCVQR